MYQHLNINPDGGERLSYNDPDLSVRCVDGNLSCFINYAAGCHWHNDFEILLATDGDIEYFVNGTVVPIRQGQAIFVNANRLHYGFSSAQQECLYICLVFHPDIFGQSPLRRMARDLAADSFADYLLITEYETLQRIRHIYDLYQKREAWFEFSVMAGCCELIRLLERQMDLSNTDSPPDPSWLSLRQMVGFLQANFHRTIRLEEIAASGAVCRSKCCQLFREKMGTTPMTYLNRYRLEKAREYLLVSQETITEIAHSCGFESSSYFSEQFRRYFGISPREMQKRNK